MVKITFLVDNVLLPNELVEQKATEIYTAAPKELVEEASGKLDASLVTLTVSRAQADILLMAASRNPLFGIQTTEFPVVEV